MSVLILVSAGARLTDWQSRFQGHVASSEDDNGGEGKTKQDHLLTTMTPPFFLRSQVMMFVGSSQSYASSNPNVRFFDDSKAFAKHPLSPEDKKKMTPRVGMVFLVSLQSSYCHEMLSDAELMKEVSGADLVVGELLYPCSSLVADKLSLPHVVLSASTLSAPTAFAHGLPSLPSYVPQWNSQVSDEWSFVDRVRNVLQWMSMYALYTQNWCSLFQDIKEKHNITPNKSIQETLGRVDLIISQLQFGFEQARPIHPSKYTNFECRMHIYTLLFAKLSFVGLGYIKGVITG